MSDDDAAPPRRTATRPRAAILREIFERVAAGESMASILGRNRPADPNSDLPRLSTFWGWLISDPDARDDYQVALAARAEVRAEEIDTIADELAREENLTPEKVALARLRCDNRKWIAARMLPKRYGDKTHLVGGDGGPVEVVALTDDERRRRVAELLDAARARAAGSPAISADDAAADLVALPGSIAGTDPSATGGT